MGDRRYAHPLEKVRKAGNRSEAIRNLPDDEVVQALAAASQAGERDAYLANVLATEALNRVHRNGAITRTAAEALVSLDMMGRITHANPATSRSLGATNDELRGAYYHDYLYLVERDGSAMPIERCPIQRVLETGDSILSQEVRFRRKNGEVFPALASIAPIQRDGQHEGAVLTFIDITQRKQAEESLWSERKRLYQILDHLSEGIILVGVDGLYEYANPSALRMLQLRSGELQGLDARRLPIEVFTPNGERVPPDRWLSRRVASSHASIRGERLRIQRRDGTQIAIEVDANPVQDKDGKVAGSVLSFDDITKRLEDERVVQAKTAELEELTSLYEALLSAQGRLNVGYVLAQNERIMAANDVFASMVGYSLEELHRLPSFLDLLVDHDWGKLDGGLQRTNAGLSASRAARVRLRHKTGRHVPVEIAFQRVPNRDSIVAIVRERGHRLRDLV